MNYMNWLRVEGVSAQIAENGRGVLYAAVNVICRNGALGAESSLIQLCRNYAIEGSTDPEPVFDAKYHLPFDNAGWGSPVLEDRGAPGAWAVDMELLR